MNIIDNKIASLEVGFGGEICRGYKVWQIELWSDVNGYQRARDWDKMKEYADDMRSEDIRNDYGREFACSLCGDSTIGSAVDDCVGSIGKAHSNASSGKTHYVCTRCDEKYGCNGCMLEACEGLYLGALGDENHIDDITCERFDPVNPDCADWEGNETPIPV